MCLLNATNGKNWIRQFNNKKYITCYKIVQVGKRNNGKYFLVSEIMCHIYRAGNNFSDRKKQQLSKSCNDNKYFENGKPYWYVNNGIHVFTTLQSAKDEFGNIYDYDDMCEVIVAVRCRPEDLVAYSSIDKEAVFMKVQLEAREFDRAIEKVKKKNISENAYVEWSPFYQEQENK